MTKAGDSDKRIPCLALYITISRISKRFILKVQFCCCVRTSWGSFSAERVGSNALKDKEVFPLFMNNELWLGASIHSGDRAFYVPDDYPLDAAGCGIDETERRFIRVKGVRWFTNLDMKQRHEEMILVKRYNAEDYPRYLTEGGISVLQDTGPSQCH